MDAWLHHVSRGRVAQIKTILRQTFANDVTVGDHANQPVILSNWDGADVVRAHQFREFGDRGIRADPLDPFVHCFFDFHADLLVGVGCTYDETKVPLCQSAIVPAADRCLSLILTSDGVDLCAAAIVVALLPPSDTLVCLLWTEGAHQPT